MEKDIYSQRNLVASAIVQLQGDHIKKIESRMKERDRYIKMLENAVFGLMILVIVLFVAVAFLAGYLV